MSHMETEEQTFYLFDDKEKQLIEKWLTKHGYPLHTNTVCGSCCGMFSDYYYVNGICGTWNNANDRADFIKFLRRHKISASVYSYHIDADPEGGDGYDDNTQLTF